MDVGGAEFRKFADLIELSRIEVYGRVSDPVLERLHQKARMLGSGTVSVHELSAGFARGGRAGAPPASRTGDRARRAGGGASTRRRPRRASAWGRRCDDDRDTMSAMRDDDRVSWTIRRAGPGDAAALGTLAPRLFRQAYEPTHPEPTLGAYLRERFAPERIEALLADPNVRVLLVEAASRELLGYAQLQTGAPGAPGTAVERPLPGSRPLEIVRFYVDEAWHGRGIAAALMGACDAEARARGADVLWLQAWQQARRALAFYAKAGFQVVGTAVFTF